MTDKDYAKLIEEFYAERFYLSYSGLNKLLYSPNLFYRHYVLKERDEKIESYLIDGKVIHCLLLDNGSFNDQFVLIPNTLPTESTRRLVDAVYEKVKDDPKSLGDYVLEILAYLKEVNLHQSLKTDQQRYDKIVTEDAKSYFEFLKQKGNKDLIDSITLDRCKEAVAILSENITVRKLLGLGMTEFDDVEIYNEILLYAEKPLTCCGLKGIVDNIKVDHRNKTIDINDIKTTGKTLSDFKETVEFYNYWMQAAIYHWLVTEKFFPALHGYTVKFNFIVIDKYQQVYCFPVSDDTMKDWRGRLVEKLVQFSWHYINRRYDLPYEFAVDGVTL